MRASALTAVLRGQPDSGKKISHFRIVSTVTGRQRRLPCDPRSEPDGRFTASFSRRAAGRFRAYYGRRSVHRHRFKAVAAEDADAGFLALSRAGDLYVAGTAYLAEFADAGRLIGRSLNGAACAGVVHNAIMPRQWLAALVVETTLAAMGAPNDCTDVVLRCEASVPLKAGARNALTIDASGRVLSVIVRDTRYLTGQRNFGLGYRATVLKQALAVGYARYQPYLRAVDGRIESINGLQKFDLSVNFAARAD